MVISLLKMMAQQFYTSNWKQPWDFLEPKILHPGRATQPSPSHNGQAAVHSASSKGSPGRDFMAIGFVWAIISLWPMCGKKMHLVHQLQLQFPFLPARQGWAASIRPSASAEKAFRLLSLDHTHSQNRQLRCSWGEAWTFLFTESQRWRNLTWVDELGKDMSLSLCMAELALRLYEAVATDLLLLGPRVAMFLRQSICGILPKTPRGSGEGKLRSAWDQSQGISCHFVGVNMTNLDPQETFYGDNLVLSKKMDW